MSAYPMFDGHDEITVWHTEDMFAFPKGAMSPAAVLDEISTRTYDAIREAGGHFISGGVGPIGSGPSLREAVTAAHAEGPLEKITFLHHKKVADGMTDGSCAECGLPWPCATYHVASLWGVDSYLDCEDQGWCSHESVPMARQAS